MDKELKTRKELIEKLESNLKEQQDEKELEIVSVTVESGNLDFADLLALSLLHKEI